MTPNECTQVLYHVSYLEEEDPTLEAKANISLLHDISFLSTN